MPLTSHKSRSASVNLGHSSQHKFLIVIGFVAVVLAVYRWTAPQGLVWAGGGADGGELALAAYDFGIAHPPGYGLFTLLGGVTIHSIPIGSPAQRLQLLSHGAALTTALLIGVVVYRLVSPETNHKRGAAALTSAVLVALNAQVWSQAIIIEVYTVMMALFSALLWFSVQNRDKATRPRLQVLAGFVYGMAITHHLSALLWLPGFAIYNVRWGWRGILRTIGGIVLGLWPWVWMLLRAGQVPRSNWGGIENGFESFVRHITAQDYTIYLRLFTLERLFNNTLEWLQSIINSFTLPMIIVAVVGVIVHARHKPLLTITSLTWIGSLLAFTSVYEALNTRAEYLLPLTLILSVWAGFGTFWLISRVKRETLWAYSLPIVLAGVLVMTHGAILNRSNDTTAHTFAMSAFETLPLNTIIVTANDPETFTLWYYHYVERQRPDIWVINLYLLSNDWYRQNITHLYPEIEVNGDSITAWLGMLLKVGRPVAMSAPVPGYKIEQIGQWYIFSF